ncbi:MAG: helix-turn-helix domain-containing protein [Lentimicrobium sp.]|jgi:predicted transcriptional regulator|nr:helix-turn-helix domain-containing protein [Lentimicrobium sp.]MDD4597947.1 helix-turn-helix domain-containing protein [Lentimicrobiaceae bacterium]MDY0024533.1 helix-turn-helix domain-containing protein [Lentimicrobium sp.]HAH58081.1 transcriptional regulator [Bacteroidales bacterium]
MVQKVKLLPEIEEMAALTKAMGHPVRLYILQKLAHMNTCCYSGDLVDELPVGRSTLSQHLKELKYAGLIQGETDPPYIKYCLNRDNWARAKSLFEGLFAEATDLKQEEVTNSGR